MRNIAHIDLNAFFAQCEENRNPALKGRPVAVGGDHRRGICSTANYPARRYGVHSAMPVFQAKRLCPGLIVLPGDYALYSQVSHRFMAYLRSLFAFVEPVSVDEAYIDLTDVTDDAKAADFLRDLQLGIYMNLNLKCSIGYAHTRFLAKMASDFRKPMGLTVVSGDEYRKLFWPLGIERMWGIGKKTAPRLRKAGILTIGDLARTDSGQVRDLLGSSFGLFVDWANGRGDDKVDISEWDRKSISASRTLYEDSDDPAQLKELLRALCREAVGELRSSGKKCRAVTLTLRSPDFSTHSKRAAVGRPSDDFEEIYLTALRIFGEFYKGGPIRLLGIGLEDTAQREKSLSAGLFMNMPGHKPAEASKGETSRRLVERLNSENGPGVFTLLGLKDEGTGDKGK